MKSSKTKNGVVSFLKSNGIALLIFIIIDCSC